MCQLKTDLTATGATSNFADILGPFLATEGLGVLVSSAECALLHKMYNRKSTRRNKRKITEIVPRYRIRFGPSDEVDELVLFKVEDDVSRLLMFGNLDCL